MERGKVTRIVGAQVFVEVPRLGAGHEFGPCDVLGGIPLGAAVGDAVVVGSISGIPDDVVVLGFVG